MAASRLAHAPVSAVVHSLGVLAGASVLAGCALLQPDRPAPVIPAAAPAQPLLALAPPWGPARRIVQQLTVHWPGREQSLLCVLELDSRHIAVAGVTQDGLSLFSLSYDGKTLQAERNPMLPDVVAAELIIADVQLAYWPLALLRQRLPKAMTLAAGPDFRRLSENGQTRIEVRYLSAGDAWPRTVELIHWQYHYRLSITTVSYEVISE